MFALRISMCAFNDLINIIPIMLLLQLLTVFIAPIWTTSPRHLSTRRRGGSLLLFRLLLQPTLLVGRHNGPSGGRGRPD